MGNETAPHAGLGTWSLDVRVEGGEVVLNGTKVVDVKDTKHGDGPVALQYGAGTVKFRNIRIRRL